MAALFSWNRPNTIHRLSFYDRYEIGPYTTHRLRFYGQYAYSFSIPQKTKRAKPKTAPRNEKEKTQRKNPQTKNTKKKKPKKTSDRGEPPKNFESQSLKFHTQFSGQKNYRCSHTCFFFSIFEKQCSPVVHWISAYSAYFPSNLVDPGLGRFFRDIHRVGKSSCQS